MSGDLVFSGWEELSAALKAMPERVVAATEAAVAEGASLIEAGAKQRSGGRPGPNVVTGSHRRSIHVEGPQHEDTKIYADIGPSMIYSRRLELGFVGEDSLGRHYNQAPLPYLQPAVDEASEHLADVFLRHWGAAIEGA